MPIFHFKSGNSIVQQYSAVQIPWNDELTCAIHGASVVEFNPPKEVKRGQLLFMWDSGSEIHVDLGGEDIYIPQSKVYKPTQSEINGIIDDAIRQSDDYEAWVAHRHDFKQDGSGTWYLGATSIAAIAGLSQFGTALTVYNDYRNKGWRKEDKKQQRIMQRGHVFEEAVAQTFYINTGWELLPCPPLIRHPKYYHLGVNLDRMVMHPKYGPIPLECKTHKWFVMANYGEGLRFGEDGTEDEAQERMQAVVDSELIQCNWQCHLSTNNPQFAALAVQHGLDFDDQRMFLIPYSAERCAKLEIIANNFINNHLIPGIPPDPTGSEADVEIVKRLYPVAPRNVLQAKQGGELDLTCAEFIRARSEYKQDETTMNLHANTIKTALGELYTDLYSPSAGLFTYRNNKDKVNPDGTTSPGNRVFNPPKG